MDIIKKINKPVFYISLFLMSFMFSTVKNIADYDLWHRMAVGKIFSQLGNVVHHDIFTYFPSKPVWVDHEWISGIVLYDLGHYFGDYGILCLKTFILFSMLLLIYRTNQIIHPEPDKQRISWYVAAVLALILGVSSTLRCQAFTYLFFVLWLYVLERVRRGENRLIWIFPVTTLIWANMHAGFVAGFGLIGFYAVGEFLNRKSPLNSLKYLGILALCLPATLINPYGIKYWVYLKDAVTMQRPLITEWYPLNPFEYMTKVIGIKIQFLLLIPALLFHFFSAASMNKKKKNSKSNVDWVEIIAFLTTLYLSIQHLRHVVFLSIIIAVFGYKYFAVFMDAVYKNTSKAIFSIISENKQEYLQLLKFSITYSFVINICLVSVFQNPREINISLEGYPVKAIEFIKINRLEGNLLVPFNWGSYAMWELYPQNLISIDGRYEETYTNQAYQDSTAITFCQKDWGKAFNRYHHDVILMYRGIEITRALEKLKDWKEVYKDKDAVVFVPALTPEKKYLKPTNDEEYYIRTKYENNIDF